MNTLKTKRPTEAEMYRALCERNPEFEGLFFVGVKTTGIFCRPTCPARKPKRENVDFFPSVAESMRAGFRPCKRCRPLEVPGAAPGWLQDLLDRVEAEPNQRWTDSHLRSEKIEPSRVRRWFKRNHGMTFQAYLRKRRLAMAMGQINTGESATTQAALNSGYESISGFRQAFKNWFGTPPSKSKSSHGPVKLHRILTPLGPMVVAATDSRICLLEFHDRVILETQLRRVQTAYQTVFVPGKNRLIDQVEAELAEYFCGKRIAFTVPCEAIGTEFQMAIWSQLETIPYGQTVSYDQIATGIGKRGAQRAVGRANGDNRIAILIPCHRVIRSDGTLNGYGGGVWRKRWLLDHESRVASS